MVFMVASEPLAVLASAFRVHAADEKNTFEALVARGASPPTRPAKESREMILASCFEPAAAALAFDDAERQTAVLKWLLGLFMPAITGALQAVPSRIPVDVHLEIGSTVLSHEAIQVIWNTLPAAVRSVRLNRPPTIDATGGIWMIDTLLDRTDLLQRDVVTVLISANLNVTWADDPPVGSGEAACMMLLCPAALARNNEMQVSGWMHRPQKESMAPLGAVVSHALKWARIKGTALGGTVQTGFDERTTGRVRVALGAEGRTGSGPSGPDIALDTLAGNTAMTAQWLAAVLALNQATTHAAPFLAGVQKWRGRASGRRCARAARDDSKTPRIMNKYRIEVVSYLLIAVTAGCVIWFRGDLFWLDTELKKALAIVALSAFLITISLYFGVEPKRNEADAAHTLAKLLHGDPAALVGTTQVLLAPQDTKVVETSAARNLELLREQLRQGRDFKWKYRKSWLLLAGDDNVIKHFLPELVKHGWLVTDAAVLLWNKTDKDGRPDESWLRQVRAFRRQRPIDAVILALDGAAPSSQPRGTDFRSVTLAHIAAAMQWSAPVYVVDVAQTDEFANGRTAVNGCEFTQGGGEREIETALLSLRSHVGNTAVGQLIRSDEDRYSAELSKRLDKLSAPLAVLIASLSKRQARHQSVSGVFFAPFPVALDADAVVDPNAPTSADLPLWTHIATISRKARGKRMGLHPVTVFASIALVFIGVWTAGMLISGITNARNLIGARETIQALKTAPDSVARLNALLALQQQIGFSEQRVAHQPPLWSRFGLNQDKAILAGLWPSYTTASKSIFITPIQENLEARLVDLSQMPTDSLDDRANSAALEGHKVLKAYLMLAEPNRVDADFITPQLTRYWTTNANVSVGAKLDISERLSGFYAQHLKAHDAWRIQPRAELVNASRQTLLSMIGVRNSEDTVYQSVLAGVGNKYPDQTLASLTTGTDTRGLIRTAVTVPGVYTRQAYEGYVAAAITEAAKSRDVARDWALANSGDVAETSISQSTDALEAALTTQYFNDYAAHWQTFMNALQWQSAPNIPAAIEQMKLLADARQSPVIALMKSIDYQGNAGMRQASLSDTLVAKAQNIFGKKDDVQAATITQDAGPLSAAFGPVLRLIGEVGESNKTKTTVASDVSLQRYLERITALRLKLQQISGGTDADIQTRQLAQALFQGKNSELADTQAYAQLVSASLGAQWSGMGDALFVRPVAQATQIVVRPAQASLNDVWREDISVHWNKSFAGRYPFDNTGNDASIPELARFIRLQGGLISSFLSTQLAGVLALRGDQWVEVNTRGGSLQFDPDFLRTVNILQRVAGHLMPEGEPQYRFDLKPIPTPGITDTVLTLDAQKLHYYNQRETWQGLMWPSNDPQVAGTRLQWQTETAGTSKNFEFGGRWAFVRMLERAKIDSIDSATFQLTWQVEPDTRMSQADGPPLSARIAAGERGANRGSDDWGASAQNSLPSNRASLDSLVTQPPLTAASPKLTYPLSYFMRVEVGKGPLELLALRGFKLPNRMFIEEPHLTSQINGTSPPPLPKAAREAAKQAATPLPSGDMASPL